MPQSVNLEASEADLVKLEAALDKVLIELRRFGSEEDVARQARVDQMREETHHFLRELRRMVG